MGLFGKKNKQEQRVQDLQGQLGQMIGSSQQAAADLIAQSGVDLAAVMGQASQPGVMDGLMAHRDRVTRLYHQGVETPAVLDAITFGEYSQMLGGRTAHVTLTVMPPGGAPYVVESDEVVHDTMAASLDPGKRVSVKVAPDDPQCLMLWGTQESAKPAGAPGDDRLAKLDELRAMGALSDEEYATQRAKLDAGS